MYAGIYPWEDRRGHHLLLRVCTRRDLIGGRGLSCPCAGTATGTTIIAAIGLLHGGWNLLRRPDIGDAEKI